MSLRSKSIRYIEASRVLDGSCLQFLLCSLSSDNGGIIIEGGSTCDRSITRKGSCCAQHKNESKACQIDISACCKCLASSLQSRSTFLFSMLLSRKKQNYNLQTKNCNAVLAALQFWHSKAFSFHYWHRTYVGLFHLDMSRKPYTLTAIEANLL